MNNNTGVKPASVLKQAKKPQQKPFQADNPLQKFTQKQKSHIVFKGDPTYNEEILQVVPLRRKKIFQPEDHNNILPKQLLISSDNFNRHNQLKRNQQSVNYTMLNSFDRTVNTIRPVIRNNQKSFQNRLQRAKNKQKQQIYLQPNNIETDMNFGIINNSIYEDLYRNNNFSNLQQKKQQNAVPIQNKTNYSSNVTSFTGIKKDMVTEPIVRINNKQIQAQKVNFSYLNNCVQPQQHKNSDSQQKNTSFNQIMQQNRTVQGVQNSSITKNQISTAKSRSRSIFINQGGAMIPKKRSNLIDQVNYQQDQQQIPPNKNYFNKNNSRQKQNYNALSSRNNIYKNNMNFKNWNQDKNFYVNNNNPNSSFGSYKSLPRNNESNYFINNFQSDVANSKATNLMDRNYELTNKKKSSIIDLINQSDIRKNKSGLNDTIINKVMQQTVQKQNKRKKSKYEQEQSLQIQHAKKLYEQIQGQKSQVFNKSKYNQTVLSKNNSEISKGSKTQIKSNKLQTKGTSRIEISAAPTSFMNDIQSVSRPNNFITDSKFVPHENSKSVEIINTIVKHFSKKDKQNQLKTLETKQNINVKQKNSKIVEKDQKQPLKRNNLILQSKTAKIQLKQKKKAQDQSSQQEINKKNKNKCKSKSKSKSKGKGKGKKQIFSQSSINQQQEQQSQNYKIYDQKSSSSQEDSDDEQSQLMESSSAEDNKKKKKKQKLSKDKKIQNAKLNSVKQSIKKVKNIENDEQLEAYYKNGGQMQQQIDENQDNGVVDKDYIWQNEEQKRELKSKSKSKSKPKQKSEAKSKHSQKEYKIKQSPKQQKIVYGDQCQLSKKQLQILSKAGIKLVTNVDYPTPQNNKNEYYDNDYQFTHYKQYPQNEVQNINHYHSNSYEDNPQEFQENFDFITKCIYERLSAYLVGLQNKQFQQHANITHQYIALSQHHNLNINQSKRQLSPINHTKAPLVYQPIISQSNHKFAPVYQESPINTKVIHSNSSPIKNLHSNITTHKPPYCNIKSLIKQKSSLSLHPGNSSFYSKNINIKDYYNKQINDRAYQKFKKANHNQDKKSQYFSYNKNKNLQRYKDFKDQIIADEESKYYSFENENDEFIKQGSNRKEYQLPGKRNNYGTYGRISNNKIDSNSNQTNKQHLAQQFKSKYQLSSSNRQNQQLNLIYKRLDLLSKQIHEQLPRIRQQIEDNHKQIRKLQNHLLIKHASQQQNILKMLSKIKLKNVQLQKRQQQIKNKDEQLSMYQQNFNNLKSQMIKGNQILKDIQVQEFYQKRLQRIKNYNQNLCNKMTQLKMY